MISPRSFCRDRESPARPVRHPQRDRHADMNPLRRRLKAPSTQKPLISGNSRSASATALSSNTEYSSRSFTRALEILRAAARPSRGSCRSGCRGNNGESRAWSAPSPRRSRGASRPASSAGMTSGSGRRWTASGAGGGGAAWSRRRRNGRLRLGLCGRLDVEARDCATRTGALYRIERIDAELQAQRASPAARYAGGPSAGGGATGCSTGGVAAGELRAAERGCGAVMAPGCGRAGAAARRGAYRLRLRRRWRARFAVGGDQRHGGADRNLFAFLHHEALQDAVLEHLDLDRAFLGLDHGDDIAALDRVARLDQPLEERAGLHVGAERGHAEFSHDCPPDRARSRRSPRTWGSAASSRCLAYGIGTSALHTRATGASSS